MQFLLKSELLKTVIWSTNRHSNSYLCKVHKYTTTFVCYLLYLHIHRLPTIFRVNAFHIYCHILSPTLFAAATPNQVRSCLGEYRLCSKIILANQWIEWKYIRIPSGILLIRIQRQEYTTTPSTRPANEKRMDRVGILHLRHRARSV